MCQKVEDGSRDEIACRDRLVLIFVHDRSSPHDGLRILLRFVAVSIVSLMYSGEVPPARSYANEFRNECTNTPKWECWLNVDASRAFRLVKE
jgi:hypothetical protein